MAEFFAIGYSKSDYAKNGNSARRLRVFCTAGTWAEAARVASRLLRMGASGEDVLIERVHKRHTKKVVEDGRNDTFLR